MRRRGERAIGPYPHGPSWRIVLIGADGRRGRGSTRVFPTREAAESWRDRINADAAKLPDSVSVDEGIDEYEKYLVAKGNKPTSYKETIRRLRRFFSKHLNTSMDALTPNQAASCYRDLVDIPITVGKGEGAVTRQMSAASHRNMLLEARSFLRWCVGKHYAARNALESVKGEGRAKKGKAQLRIDEARAWTREALRLAHDGETGAIAALLTITLGLRASEVTARLVRDVDDGGRLFWVDGTKTDAARRVLQIPDFIQPLLLELARGRRGGDLLFGKHWRDWPREWVQKICDAAKVPRVTAHGMRGTAASLAAEAGNIGLAVATSLGHEDWEMTASAYADKGSVERAKQRAGWKVLNGGVPRKTKKKRKPASD